ncbi:hypothetical protein LWC05_05445 [Acetobacter sicerae]|uniref:SGNH hydrolase-type esterase domain-containing protein n=1 Tax=Acetobacter sicerae TaxID=85325 RepID=A0ABS8VR82_9PROT|nr:hypothetical protein [Acetobacter sicerae]MCE0743335.1 hypothetical protein [Acetobacter sicerae]
MGDASTVESATEDSALSLGDLVPTVKGGRLEVNGSQALIDASDHTVTLEGRDYKIADVIKKLSEDDTTVDSISISQGTTVTPGENSSATLTQKLSDGSEKQADFTIPCGPPGGKGDSVKGDAGSSAYQLAIANGFSGDVNAWLASLKGADGQSAYQLAVAGGFEGDQAAWIASLAGKDGKDASSNSLLFNWNPQEQLFHFRKAAIATLGGGANAQTRVAIVGDSKVAGVGSSVNGSADNDDIRNRGWPAQLAAELASKGFPVSYDNFYGSLNIGDNSGNGTRVDHRVSFTGTGKWGGVASLGANAITLQPGDTVIFTPTSNLLYDQFALAYVDHNSTGKASVQMGSQAAQEGAQFAGSDNVIQQVFTFATAAQGADAAITIKNIGTGEIYIPGGEFWNSTTPYITICNCGDAGGLASDVFGPVYAYNPSGALVSLKFDLVVGDVGTNDVNSQNSTGEAITASMLATLTTLRSQGSLIMAVTCPFRSDNYATGIVSLRAALQAQAQSLDYGLVDMSAAFNNDASAATGLGALMANDLHPTHALYGDIARIWAKVIAPPALSGVL